jgi:hypothetical protein
MAFKFSWSEEIRGKAQKASDASAKYTFELLNQAFQGAITAKKWNWPLSPSPRDIVDTGSLRESNVLNVSGSKATFKWNKDYASFVHDGASVNRKNYPARPWTEAIRFGEYGFKKFDTAGTYKSVWSRYFSGGS